MSDLRLVTWFQETFTPDGTSPLLKKWVEQSLLLGVSEREYQENQAFLWRQHITLDSYVDQPPPSTTIKGLHINSDSVGWREINQAQVNPDLCQFCFIIIYTNLFYLLGLLLLGFFHYKIHQCYPGCIVRIFRLRISWRRFWLFFILFISNII